MLLTGCVPEETANPTRPDTVPNTPPTPLAPVAALFSVSDSQQVRFSHGNLQYIAGEWRFAERQTDMLPSYDEDSWDLFGWSTAISNWGMSTETSSESYHGDFIDWGTNPDLIATLGEGWRTLSADEWDYLLNHRHFDGDSGLYYSYMPMRVDGLFGLIIFPDGYTQQMASTGVIPDSCVFLPAAGSREGETILGRQDGYGAYWTSSPDSFWAWANAFFFHHATGITYLSIDHSGRCYGASVRLARNI